MLIVHYLHGEEGKSHTKTRRHKEDGMRGCPKNEKPVGAGGANGFAIQMEAVLLRGRYGRNGACERD